MAVLDDEVGMRWSGRRSAVYENGIVTWFGMMGAQRYRKSDIRKAQNEVLAFIVPPSCKSPMIQLQLR